MSDLRNGHASKPYSNTGMHLVRMIWIITSDARPPILPNTAFVLFMFARHLHRVRYPCLLYLSRPFLLYKFITYLLTLSDLLKVIFGYFKNHSKSILSVLCNMVINEYETTIITEPEWFLKVTRVAQMIIAGKCCMIKRC